MAADPDLSGLNTFVKVINEVQQMAKTQAGEFIEIAKQVGDTCAADSSSSDDEDGEGAGAGAGAGSGSGGGAGAMSAAEKRLVARRKAVKGAAREELLTLEQAHKDVVALLADADDTEFVVQELRRLPGPYLFTCDDGTRDDPPIPDPIAAAAAGKTWNITVPAVEVTRKFYEDRKRPREERGVLEEPKYKRMVAEYQREVKGDEGDGGGGEDEDEEIQFVGGDVSLVCPLSQKRFVDPVITKCKHTFDKKFFLDFFQRRGRVACPVCQQPVAIGDLKQDRNMVKLLKKDAKKKKKKR